MYTKLSLNKAALSTIFHCYISCCVYVQDKVQLVISVQVRSSKLLTEQLDAIEKLMK